MAISGSPSGGSNPSGAQVPVFDFGGVLFDWNPRYLFRRCFDGDSEAVERFLAKINFESWNAGMDHGHPFAMSVDEWAGKFPRYAEPIRAFDTRWEETVHGFLPGMEELLRRLIHAGRPLCALSNSSAEKFPVLRRKHSVLDSFQHVLLSGEVGITKPDPRISDLFLKQAGRNKETLLFVDDMEFNVSAARKLGWDAIRFSSTEDLERELAGRRML